MAKGSVKFLSSGDTALTVQFGTEISKELNNRIMALSHLLEQAEIDGVRELVPTYRSLLVHYDPLAVTREALTSSLGPLIERSFSGEDFAGADNEARHWQIPICFDGAFASDLEAVSAEAGLSPEEVISLMLETTHHVYMLGFAPGQPYMGDLPDVLDIPRRKDPVPRIEQGSLVTATGLSIIYSFSNPTGWHVIGRTPIALFSLERTEPVLLSAGDKVTLRRISEVEFSEIESAVGDGSFDIEGLRV